MGGLGRDGSASTHFWKPRGRLLASMHPHKAQQLVEEVSCCNDRLGLREMVRSLDYFRCVEYPLATAALAIEPHLDLLDMGCGRGPYALFLAARRGQRVRALDLDPDALAWQRRGALRLALSPGEFATVQADSRDLPFPDASFDRVLNLGSIEHIRDNGDSVAAAEMARVLRPGGLAVLTIPFGLREQEIEAGPHVPSFERRYDENALQRRLIGPSGLDEVDRTYYGEPGFELSRVWYALPWLLRLPLRRLGRHLAARWLRPLAPSQRERACGVCVTLQRSG